MVPESGRRRNCRGCGNSGASAASVSCGMDLVTPGRNSLRGPFGAWCGGANRGLPRTDAVFLSMTSPIYQRSKCMRWRRFMSSPAFNDVFSSEFLLSWQPLGSKCLNQRIGTRDGYLKAYIFSVVLLSQNDCNPRMNRIYACESRGRCCCCCPDLHLLRAAGVGGK